MANVDHLLTAYERGKLTRRQLLSALALVATGTSLSGQQQPPPLGRRARLINHVQIGVSNLPRSREFYQKLGFAGTLRPIVPPLGGATYALDCSNGPFISLLQTTDPARLGKISHFCIGLDDYQAQRDAEALRAAGIAVPQPASWHSFSVRDPDGISVQLSDTKQTFD